MSWLHDIVGAEIPIENKLKRYNIKYDPFIVKMVEVASINDLSTHKLNCGNIHFHVTFRKNRLSDTEIFVNGMLILIPYTNQANKHKGLIERWNLQYDKLESIKKLINKL